METESVSFTKDFLATLVHESKPKPKLYDTNYASQVLLGRPEIDDYRTPGVDLLPKDYFMERLVYTKRFASVEEENQWLKRSEQQNRTMVDPDNPKEIYYISTTIHEDFIRDLALPTGKALRWDIDNFQRRDFKSYDRRYKFKNLAERLLNAYLFKWTYFLHIYWALYQREDVIAHYAKRHALALEVLALEKEYDLDLSYLHKIYTQIGKLFFKKISLSRFYKIIRPIKRNPELAHLVIGHGAINKHKENIKFSYEAKLLAFNEYCYRNKKMPEILVKVNALIQSQRDNSKVKLELKTLQNFLGMPMVKNLIFIKRYQDDIDTRDYLLPLLERRRCSRANMQWQMDTFDIPVACLPFPIEFFEKKQDKFVADLTNFEEHKHKTGTRVKCCIVTDNMSGLPVGYACSYSENRWLQIAALRMAVMFTKIVPFELCTDNHAGYNTPEFQRIIHLFRNFGCRYRQCEVQRPQDKSIVERTILSLHSIFRQYSGYTSHSPLSRRRDSHMAEDYKKLCFKSIHLRDIDAVKAMIPEVMTRYANHSFDGKPTPQQLYETSMPLEGRELAEWKIAQMFYEEKHIETVTGSKCTFIVKGVKFIYHIVQQKGQLRLNGHAATLRYNLHDPDVAYLFDATTDLYLCSATKFNPPGAIIEDYLPGDEEAFKDHCKSNSKSKKYFKDLHESARKECGEALQDITLVIPASQEEEVYTAEAADEYIQANDLYNKPAKQVTPIHQSIADKKIAEELAYAKDDKDAAPHEVLEEIDVNF